jgi:hypothetical protein
VKPQVEAPLEELQSFKMASAFGKLHTFEAILDASPEATLEAILKPRFEAYSDCPYCHIFRNTTHGHIQSCADAAEQHINFTWRKRNRSP